MLHFKRFIGLILIAFAATLAAACTEEQGTRTAAENQQEQQEQRTETAQQGQPGDTMAQPGQQGQATGGTMAQPQEQAGGQRQVEIAGKVEETDGGLVIRSVNDSYRVSGRDLSDMVGKDVRVTGTLEEKDGQQTISVESVSEMN